MELNPSQKAAVEYDGGHLLVLAGAGSGKTRTIIHRAARLIGEGVDPSRVSLLTFTRRAAEEMTERLGEMVGETAAKIFAGTFHAFCLYHMRRAPGLFGVEGLTVIDGDDQRQLFKLVRGAHEKGANFPKANTLQAWYSYIRNTTRSEREYLTTFTDLKEDSIGPVCQVFRDYEERKRVNGYLDYDDLLWLFARSLRDKPAARERLKNAYDHILVDELQDTNPLQWAILDTLRDPARLFCVGDDAQSVYAFRGADFKNVRSFSQRLPGAAVMKLEDNYRSTRGVLDLCNWLLEQSPLKYDKRLRSVRGEGETPRLWEFPSDLDEAAGIVEDLATRHEDGAPWKNHMIIVRTANASKAIEAELVEAKIPYRFIGGFSLLQASHVKDLCALARCALDHRDELAWVRYLTLWPGIGDVSAHKLIRKIRACQDTPSALAALPDLMPPGKEHAAEGPRKVHQSLDRPADALRFAAEFLDEILKTRYDHWKRRVKDFRLLEKLASRHDALADFLGAYALDPISGDDDDADNTDKVTLITAHSAKGTESPVCYVARAEVGMFPHTRSLGDKDAVEEERRVLYVAFTRAMDELIVTRTSREEGGPFFGGPDTYDLARQYYFLKKIPKNLIERRTCRGFTNTRYDYSPNAFR